MPVCPRAHLRTPVGSLALLAALVACGDPAASGRADVGAEDVAEDSAPPDADAADAADDAADADADTATDDASADVEVSTDTGEGPGGPCFEDADCAAGLCVRLAPGDVPGLCASPCTSDADCADGSACIFVTTSGGDGLSVCVPIDYCADADADEFGVGPGCLGRDCDDGDPTRNLAADEVCDGVDNDCDDTVDENPLGEGAACGTGYPGRCGPGRVVCTDGLPVCVPDIPPSDEVCDGVDNDCDDAIDEDAIDRPTWYRDLDGDLRGNPDDTVVACTSPEGYVAAAGDCDDARDDVYDGAPELCDGVDNDCDEEIDEDGITSWYRDADEDERGDPDDVVSACAPPEGYIAEAGDCDDTRDDVYDGAPELCDGVDNDCDEAVDEDGITPWYRDADEDERGDPDDVVSACAPPAGYIAEAGDCDDARDDVYDGAPEFCDGVDNDCDDAIDEATSVDASVFYRDVDADLWGDAAETVIACYLPEGYATRPGDCDDGNDQVNPDAAELCDLVDNNCADGIDEPTAIDAPTWYRDFDEDLWGDSVTTRVACAPPDGYVGRAGDCDDRRALSNPDGTELCNGFDDNCVDGVDEASAVDAPTWYFDFDFDSWGVDAPTVRACSQPAQFAGRAGDCNDASSAVNPGAAEVCNSVDDNCVGGVDEGVQTPFYRDADADGWGNAADVVFACANPGGGRVTAAGDCDDANPRRYPGLAERCDGLDNNCDGTFNAIDRRGRIVEYDAACANFGGGDANDLCFGEAWNGQGYMHCHFHRSFDDGRQICLERGMDLVDINSDAESSAVLGAFNGQDGQSWDDLWLGGRENGTNRHFSWVRSGIEVWRDGSTGQYTRWRSGEPSNDSSGTTSDCISARQSDFAWNDRPCSGSIEFICEW